MHVWFGCVRFSLSNSFNDWQGRTSLKWPSIVMLSVTLNQSLAVLTHKTVDKFIVLFSFTQPPCPAGGCSPGLLGDGAGGVDMVCGSNCRQYTRSITASRVALSDGAGGVDMVCGSNCQQYTRSITASRVAWRLTRAAFTSLSTSSRTDLYRLSPSQWDISFISLSLTLMLLWVNVQSSTCVLVGRCVAVLTCWKENEQKLKRVSRNAVVNFKNFILKPVWHHRIKVLQMSKMTSLKSVHEN